MKKLIFGLIGLFVSFNLSAQEKIRIVLNDGNSVDYWVEGIKKIDFFEFEIDPKGEIGQPVDLGLSVKWASCNLGASNEYENGGFYQWTEDLVSSRWGNDWRLPTEDEANELMEKCNFTDIFYDDLKYTRVTGPNGRSIILPIADRIFYSELTKKEYVSLGRTSGYYIVDNNKLFSTFRNIYDANINYYYSVRPVYGKTNEEATLSISPTTLTLGSKKNSTGTVNVSSNVGWEITGVPSWATFSKTTGNGNAEITITSKENYEGAYDRDKVSITVRTTTGDKIATLQLSQKGVGMYFSISGTPVKLDSNAGSTATFTINTNIDFTVSTEADWLEFSPKEGNSTTNVTVRAKSENSSATERIGKIYVRNILLGTSLVEVTQAAGGEDILYGEPCITWGASKNQVKSYMSSYTIYKEEDEMIAYSGKYREALVIYQFDNGKLTMSTVAILTSQTTQNDIDSHLKKNGYTYKGVSDGDRIYLSQDQKTIVALTINTDSNVYYVSYFSNQQSSIVLYEEPYVNWGAARGTVKSAVSGMGYTLWTESTLASNNYYLVYKPKNKEAYTQYLFDNSQTLEMIAVVFESSIASVNDLRTYLSGTLSYTYKGTNPAGDQFFYLTKDGKSYAIVRLNKFSDGTQMPIVTYVSYSSVSSGARQTTRGTDRGEETEFIYECLSLQTLDEINSITDTQHDINIKWNYRGYVEQLMGDR